LNYQIIKGKWPGNPRSATVWFEIVPGGREKPGYIILVSSESVYVRASSPDELERAIER
jgi:hypothetical protein